MKLEDYYKEEEAKGWHSENKKGLHVIGTCGECKYWDATIEYHPDLTVKKVHGHCGYYAENSLDSDVTTTSKDFGCIHFEQKE